MTMTASGSSSLGFYGLGVDQPAVAAPLGQVATDSSGGTAPQTTPSPSGPQNHPLVLLVAIVAAAFVLSRFAEHGAGGGVWVRS